MRAERRHQFRQPRRRRSLPLSAALCRSVPLSAALCRSVPLRAALCRSVSLSAAPCRSPPPRRLFVLVASVAAAAAECSLGFLRWFLRLPPSPCPGRPPWDAADAPTPGPYRSVGPVLTPQLDSGFLGSSGDLTTSNLPGARLQSAFSPPRARLRLTTNSPGAHARSRYRHAPQLCQAPHAPRSHDTVKKPPRRARIASNERGVTSDSGCNRRLFVRGD